MPVLLDENLPKNLKWRLEDVEVMTVAERGWNGIKNGKLLKRAEKEFDVLMTIDRSIEFQQNLSEFNLIIFLLTAPNNDYDDLLPIVPKINKNFKQVHSDNVIRIYE